MTVDQAVPIVLFVLTVVASFVGFAFKNTLSKIDQRLEKLEESEKKNHEKLHQDFVSKEDHNHYVGRSEALISKIFEQLNGLAKDLNQTIGQLNLVKEIKKYD